MKRLFPALAIVFLFSYCDSTKSTKSTSSSSGGSSSAEKRLNMPQGATANETSTDTVILTGSSYIPVEGRTFRGPVLEGVWELESINGTQIPERSGLKPDVTAKVAQDAAKANMKNGTEVRTDTIRTKAGMQTSTTTTYWDKQDTTIRITPPQGGEYHMPEKPSLRFYGLNETFSGFTGCNKISGRYTTTDSTGISFNGASPSTKMVCMGDYDEDTFVNALHSITAFKLTKNELQLLSGGNPVLIFHRIE